MKELITHLWREHKGLITRNSIKNCHCKGVHSIMLINYPEHRVRLYYTTPDHELWRNIPSNLKGPNLSIGFHSHHRNLTLKVIKGNIINWIVRQSNMGDLELYDYGYESPITSRTKKGRFLQGPWTPKIFVTVSKNKYFADNEVFMYADEIHTVGVEAGEEAAWFVFEGLEDPEYKNPEYKEKGRTYSNDKFLASEKFEGLYQPMVQASIEYTLKSFNLL